MRSRKLGAAAFATGETISTPASSRQAEMRRRIAPSLLGSGRPSHISTPRGKPKLRIFGKARTRRAAAKVHATRGRTEDSIRDCHRALSLGGKGDSETARRGTLLSRKGAAARAPENRGKIAREDAARAGGMRVARV